MIDELQRDLEDDEGQVVQPTMEDAEEVTPRALNLSIGHGSERESVAWKRTVSRTRDSGSGDLHRAC